MAVICACWLSVQSETLAGELQSVNEQLAKICDEKCTLVSSICHILDS